MQLKEVFSLSIYPLGLIYNNPNNANVKLDCVLSQNGYLIDKETGLYILDLNGSPF